MERFGSRGSVRTVKSGYVSTTKGCKRQREVGRLGVVAVTNRFNSRDSCGKSIEKFRRRSIWIAVEFNRFPSPESRLGCAGCEKNQWEEVGSEVHMYPTSTVDSRQCLPAVASSISKTSSLVSQLPMPPVLLSFQHPDVSRYTIYGGDECHSASNLVTGRPAENSLNHL